MASSIVTPIEQIIEHIKSNRNFVLQGGAGSGKTETLKQVVEVLSKEAKSRKIACITYTNKAAAEISGGVLGDYKVSTIHAFLNELISPFKTNIKRVFPELFILPLFVERSSNNYKDEKEWKLEEHKRFKKAHEKLTSRCETLSFEAPEKVTGKPVFDKDPGRYISEINELIGQINQEIVLRISNYDSANIVYNDASAYNNFSGRYGHDGLIEIATRLLDKYPLLGKILAERFDCIFIDEFQDTNPDVIQALLTISAKSGLVIGLFGDSEQAIYEGGIGDVQQYISAKTIQLVKKVDNYRCSPEVIKVANQFRCDGLDQEVALKKLDSGSFETLESRQGSAKFYYALAPQMKVTDDPKKDKELHKENCNRARDLLVDWVSSEHKHFVQLKLTNKSIAHNASFGYLWDIFSGRYTETMESMKKTLNRLQFGQLVEIMSLFHCLPGDRRAYNQLISRLKSRGFVIRSVADKVALESKLKSIAESELGAYEAIEFALTNGFIAQTDSHKTYISRRDFDLEEFNSDLRMSEFEELFNQGNNTKARMKKAVQNPTAFMLTVKDIEDDFEEMENKLKQKKLFSELFSKKLKLSEVTAFYHYDENGGDFSTMHKTKGTGIEDVIVVLDEYAWKKYDFLSCFSGNPPNSVKEIQSRKLLYVACSRTKKNLVCVRLVTDQEEASRIAKFFPENEEVQLPHDWDKLPANTMTWI